MNWRWLLVLGGASALALGMVPGASAASSVLCGRSGSDVFYKYSPKETAKVRMTADAGSANQLSIIAAGDGRIQLRDPLAELRITRSQGRCRAHDARWVEVRPNAALRFSAFLRGGDDTATIDFRHREGEVIASRFDGGAGRDTLTMMTPAPRGRVGRPTNPAFVTIVLGGSGDDVLNVRSRARSVEDYVDGTYRVVVDGGLGNDTVTGGPWVDVLAGGRGNDHLVGGDGNDNLTADPDPLNKTRPGMDDDVVEAGAGEDFIIAGAGADVIDAGPGDDTIQFPTGGQGAETRLDCGPGEDTVTLNGSKPAALVGCERVTS